MEVISLTIEMLQELDPKTDPLGGPVAASCSSFVFICQGP